MELRGELPSFVAEEEEEECKEFRVEWDTKKDGKHRWTADGTAVVGFWHLNLEMERECCGRQ